MKVFNWFRREQERGCECEEYCPCPSNKVPRHTCLDCSYYRMIDSGYGHCIAMPKVLCLGAGLFVACSKSVSLNNNSATMRIKGA